jgi:hypothetical protein
VPGRMKGSGAGCAAAFPQMEHRELLLGTLPPPRELDPDARGLHHEVAHDQAATRHAVLVEHQLADVPVHLRRLWRATSG